MKEHSTKNGQAPVADKQSKGKANSAERVGSHTGLAIVSAATPESVGQLVWNNLEGFARQKVQEFIQLLLEEEVTALLGRARSQRRSNSDITEADRAVKSGAVKSGAVKSGAVKSGAVKSGAVKSGGNVTLLNDSEDRIGGSETEDAGYRETEQASQGKEAGYGNGSGYRNGYGKPRKLCLNSGTITLKRPRVRDLEERFVSQVLPLFKRHTKEVGDLLPELYLHGLSLGDFDLALRGILGEGAPLSASSIARLKTSWQAEYEQWGQRSLTKEALGAEVVYLWVDGIYVKAGLEKEKAALLVTIGALSDGRKVVLSVKSGHRESTTGWSEILRSLKARGMSCPRLVVGDGHLGIWGALANVFPAAREQRCWNHRIMNVLDRVSEKKQPVAKEMLRNIQYADTREEAQTGKKEFQAWAQEEGFGAAARLLDEDWERMVTFYSFPKEHWKHLRTTNVVESPFAAVRLRTSAAKRYKKVDNATAMIWKLLTVAQMGFRKLNAPELLQGVAAGCVYKDGLWVSGPREEAGNILPQDELAA